MWPVDPDSGSRIPIPQHVIDRIVSAIVRFQIVCVEIGVPAQNIRIIATEATRTAINASAFMDAIRHKTGISVEALRKEEEGVIGAWGIASSVSDVEGLALDLGGGSMQMTWITSHAGNVHMSSQGSTSNGAKAKRKRTKLGSNFAGKWQATFAPLLIPSMSLSSSSEEPESKGDFLFTSQGGFRGWGYLLLYLHQTKGQSYPISIINGYTAPKKDFEDTEALKEVARTAHEIFRVSDRRRKQVPSVAFLVKTLAESLPHGINEAHFCQGGVREGVLFREMLPVVRQQDPLEVATARYAPPSAEALAALLLAALPRPSASRSFPSSISLHLVQAFANALYYHATMSKELSSSAALYSTSTGILASTHGTLRRRIAPRDVEFKTHLQGILTPEEVWWTRYLGKLGFVLGQLYPTGSIDTSKPRIIPSAQWKNGLGKKGKKEGLDLTISIQKVAYDPSHLRQELENDVQKIQKVGKRKNWIGGRNGWGIKVRVSVIEEDLVAR
ncbi:hypothetical protein N7489_000012 [Penicillium chrysogenum]|uniref:uncharacterized protein n=1 Tax=Penicillium chrysogenum TaxID=5076 RepID=UPI0024DF27EF|nr:uncharacterized protein N7489_000012 [Penicillium chrysogenum]KAJ5249602.1 hypothetical protein N7489_000012 [Penicillium chrysogenum]